MSTFHPADAASRDGLDRALRDLRPKFHRYTARMTGSVVDGEDVVQDAIVKAIEAFPAAGAIVNVEGWAFRILHNAALDFLRRRSRQNAWHADDDPELIIDPTTIASEQQIAVASLRTFMQLPPSHRSCVILMDVLGYTLEEISGVTSLSVPAVKAALHKGRMRLRELAGQPEEMPPPLDAAASRRLAAYVERFNARDFDALRDLLAEDVRLDLFNKIRHDGRKDVSRYFENYLKQNDWRLVVGQVEGRAAILVFDPRQPGQTPVYFVVLDWAGEQVSRIRDFRYARHAIADARLAWVDSPSPYRA